MPLRRIPDEKVIEVVDDLRWTSNKAVSKKHHINELTLTCWRHRYVGMSHWQIRRVRQLERENAALKRQIEQLLLDNRLIKDSLAVQWEE
jgi:Transposase